VLGNHDWRGAGPAMGWALRDAGVRVLENEAVPLAERLWVAGVADTRHRFPDVDAALRDVPGDAAVLLALHDPDFFVEVPERPALTVAGHLHGGQVNVPLLRRTVLPTSYGERYIAGHVVERGRHMYVSAGIGTVGLPLRLRRSPEVPVLRLTAAAPTAPAR
jgi:predicted MPP superfamily phosphohydrolase